MEQSAPTTLVNKYNPLLTQNLWDPVVFRQNGGCESVRGAPIFKPRLQPTTVGLPPSPEVTRFDCSPPALPSGNDSNHRTDVTGAKLDGMTVLQWDWQLMSISAVETVRMPQRRCAQGAGRVVYKVGRSKWADLVATSPVRLVYRL